MPLSKITSTVDGQKKRSAENNNAKNAAHGEILRFSEQREFTAKIKPHTHSHTHCYEVENKNKKSTV
jgi:hypothetical protein